MPTLTKVAGAIAAAAAVTVIFLLWISWPGFLAVGAGALFGVAFLIVATSLGDDPRAADEAWRAQAGDLTGRSPVPPAPEAGSDDGELG